MTDAAPRHLYRAEQVRELDRRFIEVHGVPGFELMQRAAHSAFDALRGQWPGARALGIVAGPGNNGGDGLLVGALALQAGLNVQLSLVGDADRARGAAAQALAAFREAGGVADSELKLPDHGVDVVVDALLGTGLSRPLEGRFLEAVRLMNSAASAGAGLAAVDIPTGLDADTGRVWGECVRADITPSFIGAKLGLYTGAGPAYSGRILFDGLGAPASVYADVPVAACRLCAEDRMPALAPRDRAAHKGRFGHVLCVGGNTGMAGAVVMAAEAALRTGAGLTSVATRAAHAGLTSMVRPEIMCRGVETNGELAALLHSASVAAIGPGLGQDGWARRVLARALDSRLPLVVDADALNLLAQEPIARGDWVLTPHPGEAARLLGCKTSAVQDDRPEAARRLAREFNAVVVLKGAGTLVATPSGALWLSDTGNPGMASGGMGDTLTGVIAGLLAQTADPALAARLGVWIHGRAADLAAADGERGLAASDLLPHVRRLVNP